MNLLRFVRSNGSALGCLALFLFVIVLAARLVWDITGAMVGLMARWIS